MSFLIIDSETNGFPTTAHWWGHAAQPHMCQIGMMLIDDQDHELATFSCLIKPFGEWTIAEKYVEIHGITTEMAETHGLPLPLAMAAFSAMLEQASFVVAHGVEFDLRMMKIGCAQARTFQATLGRLEQVKTICTKDLARQKIPKPGKVNLGACHEHFFGTPHEGAHRAMSDVQACRRVFWRVQEQGALLDV